MPKVPDRKLSKGELLNQQRRVKPVYLLNGQEKQDKRYWRYKKKTPPKDIPKHIYKPKVRIFDKTLIAETIDHQRHLRDIFSER